MTSINRVAALAALTFSVGIGALTGCATKHPANVGQTTGVQANQTSNQTDNGTQSGSNNTSGNNTNQTTTNSTGGTNQGANFPYIVTQAMQTLPSSMTQAALAPTALPVPQNGDALSFKTTNSTTPSASQPAYQSTYSVLLQSAKGKVGSWSVWNFSNNGDAASAFSSIAGTLKPSTKSQASLVLSKNQAANVYQDANGNTTVYWQEDGWNINVTEVNSEVAPTPIADDVTNYLAANQLPSVGGNGVIRITTTDGTNSTVNAHLTWTSGSSVVSTEVTGLSVKPVDTALAMAGSIRTYSTSK